ncbi:MAG TPA: transcription antitermination factor NusB [Chlamydiales bacterium]|nr:transcription antitermination factor NusB [Chlamydiales bacterium]
MALPPQKFREIVFQILYSYDFTLLEDEEMVPFMMNELKVTKRIMLDAHDRMRQVLAKQGEIDQKIRTASTEYSFERISRVERTILRLGLFELLFDPTLPPLVAIAEAIRLCRKFGTPESSQFINAILDGIYKQQHESKSPEPALTQ